MRHASRLVRLGVLVAMLGTFLVAGSVAAAPASAATTVFRTSGSEVFFAYSTSLVEGFVFAVRSGPVGSPQTFINYLVIDRLTGSAQDGFGVIPDSAYQATAESAELHVDTRGLPGFTYNAGVGGRLDLSWVRDGNVEMETTGTTVVRTRQSKMIMNGVRSLKTAVCTGSLFDFVADGSIEATIGMNRGGTVTVSR